MFTDPNKLEIPIDGVEDALRKGAIAGFWGEIRIQVRVRAEAAWEVDLITERKTVTQGDRVQQEDRNVIVPTDARVEKVRMKIEELRDRFYLYCPITEIRASYKDGHMTSFTVTDLECVSPEPRMRYQGAK